MIEHLETFLSRIRNDGDFCDAATFRNHPLFSQDPEALQIIGYYDELEVCNPLGSHIKKHKVGVVFYNIRSTYNSTILATKPVLEKHGIVAILQPFFEDCNKLAKTGVSVCVKGANRALLAFLADNLASNKLKLGGFKMSVIGHDGMDPVFAIIEELLVIGGDMVLFCVRNCRVCYFDDHYHAYVVDHTSEQSLTVNC